MMMMIVLLFERKLIFFCSFVLSVFCKQTLRYSLSTNLHADDVADAVAATAVADVVVVAPNVVAADDVAYAAVDDVSGVATPVFID